MKLKIVLGTVLFIILVLFLGWLLTCLVLGTFPANFDPLKGVQGWKVYRVYGRFMPTPETVSWKIKEWKEVKMEKDFYLDEAVVRFCKNHNKVNLETLKLVVLAENPWIKQGTHYNIRKGDSVKFPQFD